MMGEKSDKPPSAAGGRLEGRSRLKRHLPMIAAGMAIGGLALAKLGEESRQKQPVVLKVPGGEITAPEREFSCSVKESGFDLFVTRPGSQLIEQILPQRDAYEPHSGISVLLENQKRFFAIVKHPSDIMHAPANDCSYLGEKMEDLLTKYDSRDMGIELFEKFLRGIPELKMFSHFFVKMGKKDDAEMYFHTMGELCYVQAASWLRIRKSNTEAFHSTSVHELFHGQFMVWKENAGIGDTPAEEALARYTEIAYAERPETGLNAVLGFYMPERAWAMQQETIAAGMDIGFRMVQGITQEKVSAWAGLMDAFRKKTRTRTLPELLDVNGNILREAAREVLDDEFRRLFGKGYGEVIDTQVFERVIGNQCIRSLSRIK